MSYESSPALSYAAVTPHNTTNLANVARSLYVGTGGDVVAVTPEGTAVTFTGVVGGTVLPIKVLRVNSTNTTASNIVALF